MWFNAFIFAHTGHSNLHTVHFGCMKLIRTIIVLLLRPFHCIVLVPVLIMDGGNIILPSLDIWLDRSGVSREQCPAGPRCEGGLPLVNGWPLPCAGPSARKQSSVVVMSARRACVTR